LSTLNFLLSSFYDLAVTLHGLIWLNPDRRSIE